MNIVGLKVIIHEMFNSFLDRLAHAEIHILGTIRSPFKVCGYVGFGIALILTFSLVFHLNLSLWVMTGIVLTAVSTFLGLAMLTKILAGEERLTYYHHQIAVLTFVALYLHILRQSLLPYLDLTILGVGVFLAFGRVGCLMMGCCHGKPSRWGVCYREEHAEAGFPSYFVGARLFPIQLIEALWVSFIVIVASWLLYSGAEPGTALTWYVVAYASGRFAIESWRGDGDRTYFLGFSEAQWTSLLMLVVVCVAGLLEWIPFHGWYGAALSALIATMFMVTLRRHRGDPFVHRIFHPLHVSEFAEAVELSSALIEHRVMAPNHDPAIPFVNVVRTSLGVRVSSGRIKHARGEIYHYSLSREEGLLSYSAAISLAYLIQHIQHPNVVSEFGLGNGGVYYLLVHA